MAEIKGTVFERANGTFTVLTEPTWDPKRNRFRRPSLGTFKTREDADRERLRYNISEADGVFSLSEIQQRQVRLDRYLTDWFDLLEREVATERITVRTQRDYETVVRCHILPHLGRHRLGDLTPAMLHRWHLSMKAAGFGDRTVQKAHRTLHRALADSGLRKNPAKLPKRYRLKVRDTKRGTYPTIEQIDRFLDHVDQCDSAFGKRRAVLWRVAATTGIRRGEVVGLTWSDVNLHEEAISVNQTIQLDRGSLYVKGPKSESGFREIGLDRETARRLRHHRARMLEERAAAGPADQNSPLEHDFVFRADNLGSPLNPDLVTQAFRREWAHAELAPGPTLHGLRHTNGSLLLLDGVAPIHVAAHLCHDLQTLNKVYAHELDPANRQVTVAASIGAIYG